MKKLIIACSALLVLGLGFTVSGHLLGGQLYSVYYNGALHPFSDAARDFSDKVEHISDDYVSPDDEIDSDSDTDWVQDYLETRRQAIESYDLPKQSLDHITGIDLTLKGGDFVIRYASGAGSDFALDGDASVANSTYNKNGTWAADIWSNSGTVTIVIPQNDTSFFRDINIACTQGVNLSIANDIGATRIELSTQDGTLTTGMLSAQNITLSTDTGSISSVLRSGPNDYHVLARTNGGPVTLNGAALVQLNEDGSGTALYDNRYNTETQSYRLDFSFDLTATVGGSGRIDLLTENGFTAPQDPQNQDVT